MRLRSAVLGLVWTLCASLLLADDPADDAVQKLKEDPNNAVTIRQYVLTQLGTIRELGSTDPDAAVKKVDEVDAVLAELKPDDAQAQQMLSSARDFLGRMREDMLLAKVPLEEITKKLEADPTDAEALKQYAKKIERNAMELANSDLPKALATLEEGKAFLTAIADKVKDNEDATKVVDQAQQNWDRIVSQIKAAIEREEKLAALVGKDAAALTADAWVNGQPVTDEDVKGKVVLLDFWAVWCGPCIATFPHLKEWNEQYKDQGLVMIGVTNYYNFVWNDEKNEMERSTEEVTDENKQAMHEKEQQMLVKFAEKHELHHVFAVQEGREFAEYYAVSGIPEVVLIDRAGKVRLVKVGSGPENAKAIGDMLQQLIEEK